MAVSASNFTGGAAGMAFTAPVAPRIPQMPSRKVWEKLSGAPLVPYFLDESAS